MRPRMGSALSRASSEQDLKGTRPGSGRAAWGQTESKKWSTLSVTADSAAIGIAPSMPRVSVHVALKPSLSDARKEEPPDDPENKGGKSFGVSLLWVLLQCSLALLYAFYLFQRHKSGAHVHTGPHKKDTRQQALALKQLLKRETDMALSQTPFSASAPLGAKGASFDTQQEGEDLTGTGGYNTINGIWGSKLGTDSVAQAFRAKWRCLLSHDSSAWKLQSKPRVLAWPKSPFKGCDQREGYLGPASNAKVLAGEFDEGNWPVAESLKFVWGTKDKSSCRPHHVPSFESFDGAKFCAKMRKRGGSLFIAGDSVSHHFLLALLNELAAAGEPVSQQPPSPACEALIKAQAEQPGALPTGEELPCESHLVCGSSLEDGGVMIHFSLSLFLRKVHEEHPQQVELFPGISDLPELAWGEEMVNQNASVVILNRGAHFIRDQYYEAQLNYSLNELRRLLPSVLLVYRSTASGHPNCSDYDHPIEQPLQPEHWPYSWDKFSEQNEVARGVAESLGGVFLDVQPMSQLRPDWHVGAKDCLHYCQPGPVNSWVKAFQLMLNDLL